MTYLEKMGLKPVPKLTKKICAHRVAYLEKAIKAGKFKGKLRDQAMYYKGWYKWVATSDRMSGGKKKSSKKAA